MRFSCLASFLCMMPGVWSVPKQPPISNTSALPVNFGVVVFNGFQALDVFGPLDVLNTYSLIFNTAMHLSVISKTLDPVTTVPQRTAHMNMTHGEFGEKILPTTTFADMLATHKQDRSADHSNLDVLLVPGGVGTREPMLEEIAFVKTVYPNLKYILSVCTGATILARAGILDGRKATTNKRSWDWATSNGPNVNWVHTARWVADGNIWTSSGISAGIDLTYAWLGHVYGEDVANYVAMSDEYKRWTNSTDDPFAAIWS